MKHRVYTAIIKAIKDRRMTEPFSTKDFELCCPGFEKGTYNAFLYKHTKNNPGGNSELFVKIAPGRFQCLRPFKYGL